MTVRELIDKLTKLPGNLEVYTQSYAADYDYISPDSVEITTLPPLETNYKGEIVLIE
jgi:hypothetical protein